MHGKLMYSLANWVTAVSDVNGILGPNLSNVCECKSEFHSFVKPITL